MTYSKSGKFPEMHWFDALKVTMGIRDDKKDTGLTIKGTTRKH